MVKPVLHYPDLDPADGWSKFRVGAQIRLIPPGQEQATAQTAIIVSPILGRSPALPPPDVLTRQTLAAEVKAFGIKVLEMEGPAQAKATSGLEGISFEGRVESRKRIEHRIYVLYVDELCYYAISYVSNEGEYEEYLDTFWTMARSIRPFEGRAVPRDLTAFGHYDE